MKPTDCAALAINCALDTMMRQDRGRLISALIARLKDFQLAEEALQEAMASALVHWSRNGLPSFPQGWLLQVAWRKALDRIRRSNTELKTGIAMRDIAGEEFGDEPDEIPDERLRLIFTCCHPALNLKSRVALTLRSICGLTTGEVAAAFLDQEASLLRFEPTAVVQLNRAIAIADTGAPESGLRLLETLAAELVAYQPFHAAHADLLRRAGRMDEARKAYDLAITLASSTADANFLRRKRERV